MREKYCWLADGWWLVLFDVREKHCWLVAANRVVFIEANISIPKELSKIWKVIDNSFPNPLPSLIQISASLNLRGYK